MTVQSSPEIPFEEWLPDLGEYKTGVTNAKNCIAFDGYYGPINKLSPFSSALASKCLGAFAMRATDGTVHIFPGTVLAFTSLMVRHGMM